ncbi:serine/threonine protein kinase [Chamaesiphon sp.]|uniref:serine/threonine protein kinase n=1 Tax=Chamaesiphon sp. TaxID=2814140 RepID=UPI0035946D54
MNLKETLNSHGFTLITENIGGGGSATVHHAKAISSINGIEEGTEIAVKQYSSSIITVPGQIERIRQEAQVGSKLQHENLVKTYSLIETNSNEDQEYFLILEWIDGETLGGWYEKQQKPVEWITIKNICQGIVNGVRELHKNNVFHRDIKPENIMVRQNDSAVVMDIGVAELTGNDEHTLHTSVKDFVGSVRFASPQFIMGEDFTQADDVYSIGATIFLIFTGKTIFHEVIRKPLLPIEIVNNSPQFEELVGNIPEPMTIFLQGCLHKDPQRRPTLDEISECLENPPDAKYIKKELEKQTQERRSYQVIQVSADGDYFFADLAGKKLSINDTFTVIRRQEKSVRVPSSGMEITPEKYIAKASLRHVHQNIGHFQVCDIRWVPKTNPIMSSVFSSPLFSTGSYVESTKNEIVKDGDFVVRRDL